MWNFTSKWLGLCPYKEALQEQEHSFQNVLRDASLRGEILGLEHPPVITLGKRARPEEDLPYPSSVYENQNIEIVSTDRGGQATLHSPGQLVIYPIVSLTPKMLQGSQFGTPDLGSKGDSTRNGNVCRWGGPSMRSWSVKEYVHCLSHTTSLYLHQKGIETYWKEDSPGLYTSRGKIAFFGIRIKSLNSHRISFHGVSINIMNDLSLFDLLRPCGVQNQKMDSVRLHSASSISASSISASSLSTSAISSSPFSTLTSLSLKSEFDLWMSLFVQQVSYD